MSEIETIGIASVSFFRAMIPAIVADTTTSGLRRMSSCQQRVARLIALGVPGLEPIIAAFHVAQFSHTLRKATEVSLGRGLRAPDETGDQWSLGYCLGKHGEGSQGQTRGERLKEFSPFHSITSSARASSVGSTSMPSALAVFRLTTNSYLVGACTGKSAGFSPLRMRST